MLFMDVDAAVTVPVNAMPLISESDFKTRVVHCPQHIGHGSHLELCGD